MSQDQPISISEGQKYVVQVSQPVQRPENQLQGNENLGEPLGEKKQGFYIEGLFKSFSQVKAAQLDFIIKMALSLTDHEAVEENIKDLLEPKKASNDPSNSQEEDEDPDDRDEEEKGKSVRKESSDSNQASRDENDNDTSQPVMGGKKCFNKECNSKKIYKKIRSKVEAARYRFLCKGCYQNYVNNNFCEYCEQIYSTLDDEDDQYRWIGCDECDRWNHVDCERKYRDEGFVLCKDAPYKCLVCTKNAKNGVPQESEVVKRKPVERDYEGTRNYRTKIQINKQDRIPIFHKKPENYPCLEPFLQGYNFRLWINETMVKDDIESLRALSRRQHLEEEPKKKKIKAE